MIRLSSFLRAALFFCVEVALPSQLHAEAACGSKEVEDLVEDSVLTSAKNIDTTLLSRAAGNMLGLSVLAGNTQDIQELRALHRWPSDKDYQIAAKSVIDSQYEVDLSEMYQSGQDYAVKNCEGTLKVTTPDGVWASESIKYKIVSTEDGKTLLKWDADEPTLFIFARLASQEAVYKIKKGD